MCKSKEIDDYFNWLERENIDINNVELRVDESGVSSKFFFSWLESWIICSKRHGCEWNLLGLSEEDANHLSDGSADLYWAKGSVSTCDSISSCYNPIHIFSTKIMFICHYTSCSIWRIPIHSSNLIMHCFQKILNRSLLSGLLLNSHSWREVHLYRPIDERRMN